MSTIEHVLYILARHSVDVIYNHVLVTKLPVHPQCDTLVRVEYTKQGDGQYLRMVHFADPVLKRSRRSKHLKGLALDDVRAAYFKWDPTILTFVPLDETQRARVLRTYGVQGPMSRTDQRFSYRLVGHDELAFARKYFP